MDSSHLVYEFGDFRFDRDERVLRRGDAAVPLTPKATEILLTLVARHGHIVEKMELMRQVWPDTAVEESNLTQNIYALRRVLRDADGTCPFIETVPRRGYRFVGTVRERWDQPPEVVAAESPSGPACVPLTNHDDPLNSAAAACGQPYGGQPALTPWHLLFGCVASVGILWYLGVSGQFVRRASSAPRVGEGFSFAGRNVTPVTSLPGAERGPALSPDGNYLAFAWDEPEGYADTDDIYVKQLGNEDIVRLTRGSGRDAQPVWSPDAGHIAFVRSFGSADGQPKPRVMMVPALGGAERTLWVGAVSAAGLDWSPSGTHLLFAGSQASDGQLRPPFRLLLLSIDSQQVRDLTAPPAGTMGDAHGVFSPDGQRIAFVRDSAEGTDIYVMPAAGGEPRRLTFGHRHITSLVWISDPQRLVFSDSTRDGLTTLWKLDAFGGEPERMTATLEQAVDLATDRKGRRLAFTRRVHDTNIRRVDLSSPHVDRPLIGSARVDGEPDISPDAQRITFSSDRSGSQQIWIANADGSEPRQLTSLAGRSRDPVWSPDGQQIAFASIPSNRLRDDIFVINVDGGPPRQLTDDLAIDVWPRWSRDARSIYFTSNRTRSWQLWKVPASGGRPSQVTRDGGLRASESADGRFLYYSKNPPAIWRMPVNGGEETLVLELPALTEWGGEWTVGSSGIYFETFEAPRRSAVKLFSFGTGLTEGVAALVGEREPGGGFVVSPDRRWLLYTERTYFNVDIMVVDDVSRTPTGM